jgi:hypothetical protein
LRAWYDGEEKGAFTPFSGKAQEIHDYIVNSGRAGDWIGVAKSLVNRTDQYRPGKPYMRDVPDLKERLKVELSGAVAGANDHHWEEIADWLFDEAKPY